MFTTGFMNYAFQTVGTGSNDNGLLGGIMTGPYQYHSPYKKLEEKIRKEKTELAKVQSVIDEYTRKKELAAKNRVIAIELNKKKAGLRLANLENEFLNEINRLLAVRAELMRRVRESEATLFILMKRRRLRIA